MKKPQKVIKVNTKVTFKGCCGLCLAFDCKGQVTNHQRWPLSYLHAKFEQNWSINTKVTFLKAIVAFIWPLIVTLKVLINFGFVLVTGYERITTNFNKKVKTEDDYDYDDDDGREVVQDQPGGW